MSQNRTKDFFLANPHPVSLVRNLVVLAIHSICFCHIVIAQQVTESATAERHSSKTLSDQSLPDRISFNAHIRPIMSNTCFVCHGPDEEENQSELRLDSFEAATDHGAIVPGKPDESPLYQRLINKDSPMPPADFRHQLSPRDIAVFKKWIEQGANFESHWSFSPIQPFPIPEVQNSKQVANPIDAFILQRLESHGLTLAEVANKRTLLRRLSLDLIGLPPTVEELDNFLNDQSPDAYQKQVDRLLASPHYGERFASFWLDTVRFADTVGFHGDQNQRVFAYRDYVIDSFNENKKFDQFAREQLAGDLLENPTEAQRIATALNRLNMVTREGGAQPEEYMAKYSADRVRMIGTAFIGLTTGCCECHNHKFDPMSIRDFYSMAAFFDDVQQWGVYADYNYTPEKELRGIHNDSPFPPEARSISPSLLKQIEFLEKSMATSLVANLNEPVLETKEFQDWVSTVSEILKRDPDGWQPLEIVKVKTEVEKKQEKKKESHRQSADGKDDTKGRESEEKKEPPLTEPTDTRTDIQTDHSLLIHGKPVAGELITLTLRVPSGLDARAIRMEVLPDLIHNHRVGRGGEGRFTLSLASISQGDSPIKVSHTQVDRLFPNNYSGGSEPAFLSGAWRSGPALWQLPANEMELPHTAVFHLAQQTRFATNQELDITIASADVGRIRFSISPLTRFVVGLPAADSQLAAAIQKQTLKQVLTEDEQRKLLAAFVFAMTPSDKITPEVAQYRNLIADCRSGLAMTAVTVSLDPKKRRTTRVLPRGDWQNKSGELVKADTPSFLPKLPRAAEDAELSRLDLANWLTSPENPLTARHFVNRTWKQFFGAGFSNQLDDLGNQGEWPSHPELLDWMAYEFRSDWDMKKLVRLIVTSNTYQQKVASNSRNSELDPYNRLLAHQSPRRLEAEIVRDNALAISGLLFAEFTGGESVFPYQPEGYYSNLQFPDRGYAPSPFEFQHRRGLYVHWQRTFLHPAMLNFDAPARDECVADRITSNSPQQALTLLNDPQFVETSLAMAIRLHKEKPAEDFSVRLDHAFLLAMARTPSRLEREGLEKLYQAQLAHFNKNKSECDLLLKKIPRTKFIEQPEGLEQASLTAWMQVCRVVLNMHETITRY